MTVGPWTRRNFCFTYYHSGPSIAISHFVQYRRNVIMTIIFYSSLRECYSFVFLSDSKRGNESTQVFCRATAPSDAGRCASQFFVMHWFDLVLQCLDAVGWAAGRASGL